MSCGAPIIGSDTAPVREIVTHGENGLLVDFFDSQALVEQISYALSHPEAMQPLREKARASVIKQYDLTTRCLPQQLALVNDLLPQ
jgi:glycosyltransferase involved in cell wall biosynthesis